MQLQHRLPVADPLLPTILLHCYPHRCFSTNGGTAQTTPPTPLPPLVDVDHLSTLRSKSDLLASYSVSPPVQPWPHPLFPRRLSLILRRHQTDIPLALRIFHHAGNYVPKFSHNYLTYHTIIDILARAHQFDHLESILARLANSSIPCGEEAFITVIRAYGLAGKPSAALRTFLSIPKGFRVNVSVRAFNSLLNAMIQNRKFDLVAVLFKNCQSKFAIRPNIFTCNILIKAFCKLDDLDGALKVLEEIPHWGMVPNLFTYTTVLSGYVARGDMDSAKALFEDVLDRGWSPDTTAYTVLIDGYCRLGKMIEASKVMDEMEANNVPPNDVTYSVMIESLTKQENVRERSGQAMNLLMEMLDANYMPASILCCKVVDVLCEDGNVEDACRLWRKMLDKNCMPDNSILSTLVYWLCKKGKVHEATSLFREFKKALFPSVTTYNTLMSGMCDNGELQEVARLWDDMLESRCCPNVLTYNILIKGFCKVGRVEEGVKVFEEMLEKGCAPNKVTYLLLTDELCKSETKERITDVLNMGISSRYGLGDGCWDVFVRKVIVKKCGEGASTVVQI